MKEFTSRNSAEHFISQENFFLLRMLSIKEYFVFKIFLMQFEDDSNLIYISRYNISKQYS